MFLKKITILLISSFSFFILESCSETPTDIGSGLLEQDRIDVQSFDSATDSINISASYFKRTVNLGTSSRLLLGKKGNVEAGILIRFNYLLADTLAERLRNNSITVETAWIQFTNNYVYGTETDPLDVNVYNITSGWTTSGFNSDSLNSLQYENIDRKTVDTSDTRIDIDPQLVFNWMKAAADTSIPDDWGAYIKPAVTSSKIVGYYAVGSDAGVIPYLNVVFRTGADVDTLLYSSFADIGVVSGELPQLSNNYLAVQAGLESVAKINFDISEIPKNAIINRADLTLTYDSTLSVVGNSYISTLTAAMILDSANMDSLTNAVLLSKSGNLFNADVSFIVQNWIRDNNEGLLISSSNRLLGVELFAIYGANADPYLRPRLTITYTIKK